MFEYELVIMRKVGEMSNREYYHLCIRECVGTYDNSNKCLHLKCEKWSTLAIEGRLRILSVSIGKYLVSCSILKIKALVLI